MGSETTKKPWRARFQRAQTLFQPGVGGLKNLRARIVDPARKQVNRDDRFGAGNVFGGSRV